MNEFIKYWKEVTERIQKENRQKLENKNRKADEKK